MSLIKLFITYIDKCGPLLKVFGQIDEHSGEFLEKLIYQFTETFENSPIGKPKSARDLHPGLLCCAKYKDNKYYRAEVKNIIPVTPIQVQVFFIDYGNTDKVKLTDIRLLDEINEPTFSNLQRLATEYCLAGIRPMGNEWDANTIKFIEEAVRYKTLKCAVVGEIEGTKLLKIFWGESDISSYLISIGAAHHLSQDAQELFIKSSTTTVSRRYPVMPPGSIGTASMPASIRPPNAFSSVSGHSVAQGNVPMSSYMSMLNRPPPNLQQGIPVVFRHPDVTIPPPSLLGPPPRPFAVPVPTEITAEPAQFVSDTLPEHSEHIVYVSHVEDGPLAFAVQLKAVAQQALTKLMAQLNEQEPIPISAPLLPGSICLGRFSEDQSLCRAVVSNVMNDKCRLYYPDYGNSELLSCNQIYKIPAQFIGIKVMALRFTLAGFSNIKVTPEMKTIFHNIVANKELIMKVTPVEENRTKQYCELYLNRRSVRDLMKEQLAKQTVNYEYTKLHVPHRGAVERVIICYVESPTRILVQLEANKDTLNTLMSCVAVHCTTPGVNALKHDQLKENMPVCAFYPCDSTWYRAQIKDFTDTEATVLFVDYGNEDVVPISLIQRISQDLVVKVRTQTLECCLAGFEMSQPNQELADKLYGIINEKTLTMQVLEVMKNQVLIVNLLDENNVNVASYLKSATPPVMKTPPVPATNDDDVWVNEVPSNQSKSTGRSKPYEAQSNEDWLIIKTQNDSAKNRYQKLRLSNQRSSNNKAWNDRGDYRKNSSNEDSGRNWRNKDETSPREKDRFSRDDRKSGRFGRDENRNFTKDESLDNRYNRQRSDEDRAPKNRDRFDNRSLDDKSPRKWDRSDDNRNFEDRGPKKWDRSGDEGPKKWDRFGDDRNSDDRGPRKWERSGDVRSSDDRGPRKWDRSGDEKNSDDRGARKWDRSGDEKNSDDRGPRKWDRSGEDKNSDDRGPRKWDRSGEDRNSDDRGPRKWDKSGDDRGPRKWDRSGDDRTSDDRSPRKWDRSGDEERSSDRYKNREGGDTGGFNKRYNKDNDSGGRSVGDRPKRFDDTRNKRDSNDTWASKPKWRGSDDGKDSNFRGRGGDFGGRGSFENKRSFSTQSNEGMSVSVKKAVVPYPSINLGDKEIIEVVYSISPMEFFVQNIKYKEELNKTASDLMTACATGTKLSSPEKGMYCAAMYSEDEVWYRAYIESVNGTKATVKFVDYGNGEEVEFDNLQILSNDLCELPAQAIKCGLLGAHANAENGAWSDVEQTEFAVATEGKTLQAELKYKLFSNDTFQIVLKDITEGEDNAVVINLMFNGTEEAISSINPPISGPVTLAPFHLKTGETLDVQVTWFISPNSFYVQPLNTNAEFKAMMEHIQEHIRSFKHVSPFSIKAGKFALARYKDDKVVYRAVVTDPNASSGNLVHFVDYGNSEFVETNQMYDINSEYALMPCQALSCNLASVKPSEEAWPKLGTSNIESYFNADLYTCTVVAEGEDGSYIVSLHDQEGNSVSESLISNGLAVSDGTSYDAQLRDDYTTLEPHMLINQYICAYVTCLDSYSKIFIQIIPDEALKLQKGLDAQMNIPENVKKLDSNIIADNLLCVSNLNDSSWQRAKIIDVAATTGPLLQFIDTGIVCEVPSDKIFELPSDFKEIPPQAVECGLCGDESSNDDLDEFKTEISNKNVLLYVHGIESQRLLVSLYSSEGILLKPCKVESDVRKEIKTICPMPIFKKLDKVYISHAEAGLIYVQRISTMEKLTQLLSELYDWYEDIAATSIDWKVGDLCCAQSLIDEQWYRAELMTIDPEVTVRYLDYGNSETLTIERLRKLEMSFCKSPAFALNVKMAVNWQVSEEHLLELAADKEFNAKFIKWQDSWYIELINDNNENLSTNLVELGFATEIKESPFIKKFSSISKLLNGAKVSVCRVHICSPNQFWVILNEDFEDLDKLQDKLQNSVTSLVDIKGTPPNGLIATKFSDGIWYRAVYSPSEDKVFSVDYGNSEPSSGEFKILPEELLQPDGYAIPCSLCVEPGDGGWNEEAIELFESLIPDDEITAHILKIEDVVTTDISVNDESVSEVLINKGFAVKSILTSSIFISHINSLCDFYCQEENPLLEEIRNCLTQAETFNVINNIENFKENGVLFAAQYQVDGLWYRAKLVSNNSEENCITVIFVDYGNSEDVVEFRELPQELLEIPVLAKHCSQKLPESFSEWTEEANEKFVELAADGNTLFEMKILNTEDPASVDLLLNGQSVVDQLITSKNDEFTEQSDSCKLADVKSPNLDADLKNKHQELTTAEDNKISSISSMSIQSLLNSSVYISHINSLDDFYCQEDDPRLEDIRNHLTQAETFNVIENIEKYRESPLLLAAKFQDDGLWYRAKFVSNGEVEESISVVFVDFGNSDYVTEFRELPEELLKIPLLAKHCSQKLPESLAEWPEDASEKFVELADGGATLFEIRFLNDEDPASVNLLFDGQSIVEQLNICKNEEFGEHIDSTLSETKLISDEDTVSINDEPLVEQQTLSESQSDQPVDEQVITTNSETIECESDKPNDEPESELIKTNNETIECQGDKPNDEPESELIKTNNETIECQSDKPNDEPEGELIKTDNETIECQGDKSLKLDEPLNDKNHDSEVSLLNGETDDNNCNKSLKVNSLNDKDSMGLLLNGQPMSEQISANEEKVDGNMPSEVKKSMNDHNSDSIDSLLNEQSTTGQLTSNTDALSESSCVEESFGKEKIIVSHVNNPYDFWIRYEATSLNEIEKLFKDVEKWTEISDEKSLYEGALVAAFYEKDSHWYRAKILKKISDGFKVIFCDYGIKSEVKKIRNLPEKLKEIPAAAIHSRLESIANISEWSNEAVEYFKKVTKAPKVFEIKYLVSSEPLIVQLFQGNNNISAELIKLSSSVLNEKSQQPLQQELQIVQCTHINSPEDFYVQTDESKVTEMNNLLEKADSYEKLDKVTVGTKVAARFEVDNLWYRATVTSVEENSYSVFFVDYGNTVDVTEVKALPEEVSCIPPLAHICSLQIAEGIVWSSETIDRFIELVTDFSKEVRMKVISESVPMIVDLYLEERLITEDLLQTELNSKVSEPSLNISENEHLDVNNAADSL